VKKMWFALLLTGVLCLAAQAGAEPSAMASRPGTRPVRDVEVQVSPTAPAGSTATTPLPPAAPMGPGVMHVLLLGSDRRPPDDGWRTDTMILVSVDPAEQTVSLVSIPRDLYVNIPGHGKDRLNLADNIGEAQHYPGGGPALLRDVLEDSLGLTFDRYVRIDFQGFIEMIDILGGIDVDVRCPTELWVPNMKSQDQYQLSRALRPGMLHMDGELALIYCRCRAHTPVFDRDRRQREVLLAIRNRALELGLPGLLSRLFQLLDSTSHYLQTDLQPEEMVALAQIITEIPPQNISQSILDLALAPEWTTPQGSWVMLPDRQLIKESMARRFTPPTWEEETLAAEGVLIAVENGTTEEGLALQMADRLRSGGFHVAEVGKAERLDFEDTTITSYGGESFTLERLREYLNVSDEQVLYEPEWLSNVAIRVVLGNDADSSCP
jgi:LCP family protein required for cell wall assembly